MPQPTRSVHKGVSRDGVHPKWYATIYYDDRSVPLGYYTEEIEAARAYDLRAVQVFGPYARPNFPDEWPPERRAEVGVAWLKAQSGPSALTRTKTPKPTRRKARRRGVNDG
jgi:hypothetical protein